MGELAKTLVALSGPDSVQGIIPLGILDYERPGSTVKDPQGIVQRSGKKGLLERWGFRKQTSTPMIPDMSVLQKEEVFGRVIIVSDMQARKKRMAQEVATGGPGSGFIGLSGGFGTMDELMEVVTWNQLGVHNMGVCLYNVEGYWDGILTWLDHAIETNFVRESARNVLMARETAEECIDWLKGYASRDPGLNVTWGDA